MKTNRHNIVSKSESRTAALVIGVGLAFLAGCTGEEKPTPEGAHRAAEALPAVCTLATKEVVLRNIPQLEASYLQEKMTCASDESKGITGQAIWRLNPEHGPLAAIVLTTIEEAAAPAEGPSFASLGKNVPASAQSKIMVKNEQRSAYLMETGIAVRLGQTTLIVSVEDPSTADTRTGTVPLTIKPDPRSDPSIAHDAFNKLTTDIAGQL